MNIHLSDRFFSLFLRLSYVHLFVGLPVHLLSVCRSDGLPLCLSIWLSVCRTSISLSVHLSVCPSVCLSVCPSVRLSICLSACLSVFRLFLHSYAKSEICLSLLISAIHLFVHASIRVTLTEGNCSVPLTSLY